MISSTVPKRGAAARAILIGVAIAALPMAGLSQTASSVTPESFRPDLAPLGGRIVFSGAAGTTAPPGADEIGITLGGVVLEGAFAELQEVNEAFRARLTRGRIPVSELFEATAALEAAYADAGFVLARVVLPQQSLADGGTLRVTVVDGFVETIDTSNAPPEVRARLDRLTAPLLGRTGLQLRDLERQLLLAGDTPGVALNTALATGERPGGTVLSLDPEFRGVTGFVGFDNRLPDELDEVALSAGLELNSPLSQGETFYVRTSFAPHGVLSSDPRYRVVAGGFVVPLGGSGLSFNAEFTHSETEPDDDDAPTRSLFERQSFRLLYPYIRSRSLNVTTQIAIDRQQDSQTFIGGGADSDLYEDQTTVLRASGALSFIHADDSFSTANVVLSKGLDIWGARSLEDAAGSGVGLSREGADADFTKINASFSHSRRLSELFTLNASARLQWSFGDPLPTAELISISGPSDLSAFDSGDLRGDSGWSVRAEMASPRPVTLGGQEFGFAPYAFVAAGGVTLEQPTAEEFSSESAYAYGLGIDLNLNTGSRFQAGSIRLEIGKGERDHGPDNTRVSLSGNYRF
ncbi:ShlB/FhaC/HecB family hemolysin secretion/activation protein [Jannaschia seohaensis]|uniref:Hemolysin activation/secretion protein n=1 Tax=Jannaschia seohaensis TaxID=475081 RepID=A0A2Y9C1Y6_9RHOB|nr:ShlB/FhaC/HecB family hemolysin secretion/activation protein [Jannaschia seohaensis]PWJ16545.1 hemolysin activation/secretion protein [Jannaschia seohaensis]SSA48782.1 Hemolysin activation/secretion protein [Jannaschia seohaensis]